MFDFSETLAFSKSNCKDYAFKNTYSDSQWSCVVILQTYNKWILKLFSPTWLVMSWAQRYYFLCAARALCQIHLLLCCCFAVFQASIGLLAATAAQLRLCPKLPLPNWAKGLYHTHGMHCNDSPAYIPSFSKLCLVLLQETLQMSWTLSHTFTGYYKTWAFNWNWYKPT